MPLGPTVTEPAGATSHVPAPPIRMTISVTSASRAAPRRAMISPMNTNGIVLAIRCAKLACRNGAVKMPHTWAKFRGQIPSLSSRLESSVLITSTTHISTTIPASRAIPSTCSSPRRRTVGTLVLMWTTLLQGLDRNRERDLRAVTQRWREHELAGAVSAAAARAEPVDGQRDRRREMAGVAGPAALARPDRPAEAGARPLQHRRGVRTGVHARPHPLHSRLQRHPVEL